MLLWIAGIGILAQLIVFKLLYPFAGFLNGDSYLYIRSATYNSDIGVYPIGYGKFLRLFSVFTKSDTALVCFQYLAIQASLVWFLFTLFYLCQPGKVARWLMFLFVVFNPVFLYLSNYISSDALFLSLSLFWLTSLFWILTKPTVHIAVLQIMTLLLAFMVRYNALYYPIISAVALILSTQSVSKKIISILVSFLAIVVFMLYTANQYKSLIGIRVFSPFSGWQLANNALCSYRHVDSTGRKTAPLQLQRLEFSVRHYFDIESRKIYFHGMSGVNTFYMWESLSPLNTYMIDRLSKDSTSNSLQKWASMGPLYMEYGNFIIRQYPGAFFRYYLLPNALNYYAPPEEFLANYNMGSDTVGEIIQTWFGYKSNKVRTAFKSPKVTILDFMPAFSAVANICFIFGLISIFLLNGFVRNSVFWKIFIVCGAFWFVNFSFSVFASPITLRYQLFSIVVYLSFGILFIEHLKRIAFAKSK